MCIKFITLADNIKQGPKNISHRYEPSAEPAVYNGQKMVRAGAKGHSVRPQHSWRTGADVLFTNMIM